MAVKGSAVPVTNDPNVEMVAAPQRLTKPELVHKPRRRMVLAVCLERMERGAASRTKNQSRRTGVRAHPSR